MLQLTDSAVYSTSFEAMLYGFSILLFILTMWILIWNRRRRQLQYGMLAASCALLVLGTAEMAVNIARVYQGFISVGPFLQGGPEQYFADVSQPTFVTKSCLYNAQTLILDGVVIWRTYVVWRKAWVVVVPIMGWLGLFAVSIGTNVALSTASTHASDIFAVETGRWITGIYSLTLGTNLSSTILLAYRIWRITSQSAHYRAGGRLTPILRVIIESGAIYSVTVTAALVCFVSQSNGVYVILDMISPIISIVFNMIIVRIGLAKERKVLVGATTDQGTVQVVMPAERRARGRAHSYEMQNITVEITQLFETDSEDLSDGTAVTTGTSGEVKQSTIGTGSSHSENSLKN